MVCPYARFSLLRTTFAEKKVDSASSRSPSSSSSSSSSSSTTTKDVPKLSTRLRDETSEAHREIEKSAGIRALMGSFHSENRTMILNRVDHFRYLLMLGCVYITMETALVEGKTVLKDMTPLLIRSNALLNDIQVHLDEILDTSDANPSELDIPVEEGAEIHHESLANNVLAGQKALSQHGLLDSPRLLTHDHLAILTKRQTKAVLRYTKALQSGKSQILPRSVHYDEAISFTPVGSPASLPSDSSSSSSPHEDTVSFNLASPSSSTNGGLILAHAYVRYMGDLSGGQHIVKRLSKLFPIYDQAEQGDSGFTFYSFTSTNKTNIELKNMIRTRLDGIKCGEKEADEIVDAASEAFRLNRCLFDSLLDEQ